MSHRALLSTIAFFVLSGCVAGSADDGGGGAGPDGDVDAASDATSTDSLPSDTHTDARDAPSDRCAPACAGKSCGNDGCGGSCGTRAGGQSCDATGKCVAECPCWAGECTSCYCGDGVKSYGASH